MKFVYKVIVIMRLEKVLLVLVLVNGNKLGMKIFKICFGYVDCNL
jgi:hypothetical protein